MDEGSENFAALLAQYEGTSAFGEGGLVAAALTGEVLHAAAQAPSPHPDEDEHVLTAPEQYAVWRRCAYLLTTANAAWAAAERIGVGVDATAFGAGAAFELQLTAMTLASIPPRKGMTIGEFRACLLTVAHSNQEEADNRYGPNVKAEIPDGLGEDSTP